MIGAIVSASYWQVTSGEFLSALQHKTTNNSLLIERVQSMLFMDFLNQRAYNSFRDNSCHTSTLFHVASEGEKELCFARYRTSSCTVYSNWVNHTGVRRRTTGYVLRNCSTFFQLLEEEKEQIKRKECEENKEALLQQFRRHSVLNRIQLESNTERFERVQSFCSRLDDADFCEADAKLVKVQYELLKLYQKLEVSKLYLYAKI